MTPAPDTIVLVHGFWVTPRSWEDWKAYYEAKGFTVITPAYPGFEVEVEALNADPAPIEAVTVPQIIAHLEAVVSELDRPPILIGHSAGGVFVQISSTTASGRLEWRSTRRRPRASSGCRCPR